MSLKVVRRNMSDKVRFDELKLTDMFSYDGSTWMKMKGCDSITNAVDFSDGLGGFFNSDDVVMPIRAVLTVED